LKFAFYRFKYCGTPHTERGEKRRKQIKFKGREPYYAYSTRYENLIYTNEYPISNTEYPRKKLKKDTAVSRKRTMFFVLS
jgi:hypothetical protein